MVSPIRYEAPQFGMFSADKQGINDRSPYCDRYVHHHKKSSQLSSIDQSQSKKSTLRATSSIINQRQKSTSKPRQNSHKSPSKFTVKNLLTVMAHDKSPNTHLRKSYQRTEESIDHDKKRMETLEKLAKHESMVKGLTQQVEPEEEDHYHHQGRLMSEEDEVRMQDADDKMTKDQFYGLYSLEKSEQLKYQRVQSIKKAEELLQQFMNESQSSKRPEFIQTKNVSVIEKWEPSEVVQQQYQPETIVLNEVSFQDSKGNQSSKQNVRESTRSSLVSHQIYYNDLVNLELSPEPKQITIDMQTCNFQTFDIPLSVNSMTPQELTVHQTPQQALHHHQPSDDYESYLSQTQQLNNRRKSFESTTCSSKLTTLLLQPKAKQLQQQKPIPQTKDLALNHYQSFSSAQKKHNKSSEYSNVTLASMQTPSNTNAKIRQMQQERKVEEPGFIKGISTGLIDVEMLYEHRSKSVVKKREELLKKKQMDTLSKIEARNTKVDNFKQTRNLNRLQSNQRVNTSSENLKQQQMQQQYHSKQKSRISFDSSSHTPIRTKSEANKTISSTYQSNHTESLKKSASKNQIKFEKRDKPVVNEYQQAQKSIITAPSAMQTPVNMMKNYVPSSNQSKSSKLMSECSSYRRRQEELDYKNSTQKSASKSQSTCNMLYKKQQLKSSIVNRTIRMHHQPKEYHQLKQEHQRLKQALQQTIELHCEQSTSGSTQSFIMQKLSQQQKQANQNKLKSLVPQKALNSSRSTTKINTVNKDVVKAHQQQQYQTIQVVSVDDDDDEDIVGQTQAQRECANCVRLLSKGLSTDFCLEHYGTPRYIDD